MYGEEECCSNLHQKKSQSKMESAYVRERRHSPIRAKVSEDIHSFGLLVLLIHSTTTTS